MHLIESKLAIDLLNGGSPIIFQTDTLPAIGCLPKFAKIIYETKKRDIKKPLILMGSDKKQLLDFVHKSSKEDFEKIASKYWPGALTMIIPVTSHNKSITTSEDLTLGLRIPNSQSARSFLKKVGPLLTSSANISGRSGSIRAEDLSIEFPNIGILGPLPWEKCSGNASTIISWSERGKWKLLREGEVKIEGLN